MFSFRVDNDIELRLLEERHAEEFFTLIEENREHIREWIPWVVGRNNSVEDTKNYIKKALQQFADGNGFEAGIWYKGKIAGGTKYAINWLNQTANIHYFLGVSFQDQGMATKTCRALIEYTFSDLRLNRVEIWTATENKKARAVPERLGFTQEGILRQAGKLDNRFVDYVIYGMLADEWVKSVNK
jgi:ribosomal-protein-serine acetyltransferase